MSGVPTDNYVPVYIYLSSGSQNHWYATQSQGVIQMMIVRMVSMHILLSASTSSSANFQMYRNGQ